MAGRLVRRLGIVLGVIVLLILLTGAGLYVWSGRNLRQTWDVSPAALTIPTDSASVERGRHLVTARQICVTCHGEDLGGKVAVDGMPFGRFVGSNLTPGGIGARYTNADWVRGIRHGLRPDGTSLLFMPSEVFARLGAGDLAAIIAYLKTLPPVSRSLPRTELGPIGRMIIATSPTALAVARLVNHEAPIPTAPPEGETVEYGGYIVATSGCQACHGENLNGGKLAGGPDDPPATNITPAGIGDWTDTDFLRAFRGGKRPNGTAIDSFMPWKAYGRMTDSELRAVRRYLATVPALAYGTEAGRDEISGEK